MSKFPFKITSLSNLYLVNFHLKKRFITFQNNITIKSIPGEIPFEKRFIKGHKNICFDMSDIFGSFWEIDKSFKKTQRPVFSSWPITDQKLPWRPNFLNPPFPFESLIETLLVLTILFDQGERQSSCLNA